MKVKRHIIYILLPFLLFTACGSESVSDPSFDADEMPYIHMDWAANLTYKKGDVIKLKAQVSPKADTSCRWLVDDKVVSETDSLAYTISGDNGFTLRFEAERNGLVNYRTAQVTIQKDFTPKSYNHVVTGIITSSTDPQQIQWDYVTHLQFSQLTVDNTSGSLTLPDTKALATLKTIVSLAHNEGVYVIVDIAGPTSYPSGAGFYNEQSFNTVAADPELRGVLIQNIKEFVDAYSLDGVNITINNLNNDAGALQNHDELLHFFNELAEAFPAEREAPFNHMFLTASIPMAWNNYEFYFIGNAARLDWINLNLYGATDLTPTHCAPDWQVTDNMVRFRDAAGIPMSKMVVGVAAYGIKYDIPDGVSPTWGNLDSYLSYPIWREIVKMDADAPGKSQLDIASGLFYTGITAGVNSVETKAALVKEYGALGMFVWTLDYDTSDAASSILRNVYGRMNE